MGNIHISVCAGAAGKSKIQGRTDVAVWVHRQSGDSIFSSLKEWVFFSLEAFNWLDKAPYIVEGNLF